MDLNSWTSFRLSPALENALKSMGFNYPTKIQQAVLTEALNSSFDILGAAETGSGKTLCYVIPIIEKWLMNSTNTKSSSQFAFIILPTRELAIQVNRVFREITKSSELTLSTITLIGGLSQQKQERLLKRKPDVIIATPGRLWSLIQENKYFNRINELEFLVIDEIDRLFEKGHFEELGYIINHIHTLKERTNDKHSMQTLVFSATLTFTHIQPQQTVPNIGALNSSNKLNQKVKKLIDAVRLRPKKHIVIDLTIDTKTPQSLLECRMNCINLAHKDANLYYLILRYGGRTIVFTNSIDASRRLYGIMNKLKINPLMIHAKMTEEKRLKNLEKFTKQENSLLLATDVASRGLDVNNVDNVIHYQVPKTAENYIHRSGRTARALRNGLSVIFVDPTDVHHYQKICKNLNRSMDLELLDIDSPQLMDICNERINLATQAESLEFAIRKKSSKNDWFKKMAREADLILDEEIESECDTSEISILQRQKAKIENSLRKVLVQPLPRPSEITSTTPLKTRKRKKTLENDCTPKLANFRKRFKLEKPLHKIYKRKPAS